MKTNVRNVQRTMTRWSRGRTLIGLLSLAGALLIPTAAAPAAQVYVSGSTGHNISPFSVGANGSLTPISCPGSNCTAGAAPIGVAMSPNGQFLYASSFTPSKVSVFAVAANGSLTPVSCSGSSCNTGAGPYGIAVTPNGQYLYTANLTASTVSAFSIDANGTLTPVSCPGTNCNTGSQPYGVAVSPNGQYLYTANRSSNSVSVFSIGANGSLTPVSCATCTTGSQPDGLAITPSGQFLYVANRSGASVSPFSINANGTLTPISCPGSGCSTGTNGAFSLAVSPSGQFVYTTIRNAAAKVAAFSINANGSLSQISCPGSNCTTGTNPGGVAVTPDGKFLYASVFSTSLALPFSIGSGGSLTPITCTSPNCNTSAGPDFQSVVVSPDQAPIAAFDATGARPGQPSSFDGSGSTAAPGQTVARYDWDFGDGQSLPERRRHAHPHLQLAGRLHGHPDRDRRCRLLDGAGIHRTDSLLQRLLCGDGDADRLSRRHPARHDHRLAAPRHHRESGADIRLSLHRTRLDIRMLDRHRDAQLRPLLGPRRQRHTGLPACRWRLHLPSAGHRPTGQHRARRDRDFHRRHAG